MIGLSLGANLMTGLIHRPQVYASEHTFGGGSPFIFIIDQPGVSVTGRLSILEDVLYPWSFLLNTLFWLLLAQSVVLIVRYLRNVRRRDRRRRP